MEAQSKSSSHIEKLKGIKTYLDQEGQEFVPLRSEHTLESSEKKYIFEGRGKNGTKESVFGKKFLPLGNQLTRKYSINNKKVVQFRERSDFHTKL